MSTDADVPSGESFSKDYVDSLKAQLEAKNEETAKLKAFKSSHDAKQREIISKMQPSINEYVQGLVQSDAEHAGEMAPIVEWGRTCHESSSLETAMPMARVLSCASAQFKRVRDEASQNAERANALGATMKELEEVKADRDAKVARISELEGLCNERQSAAERMQEELAKFGHIKEKFDFSKLSSREAKPAAESAVTGEGSVAAEGLVAITSLASKRVVQDDLAAFVNGNANTMMSNRVSQSSTTHALLGSSNGGMESEIAQAIRAA